MIVVVVVDGLLLSISLSVATLITTKICSPTNDKNEFMVKRPWLIMIDVVAFLLTDSWSLRP